MSDVSELESLHSQLRNVRAMLPQIMQRLAFVSDDSDSSSLFQSVAQDLNQWRAMVKELDDKYAELKPRIENLNS